MTVSACLKGWPSWHPQVASQPTISLLDGLKLTEQMLPSSNQWTSVDWLREAITWSLGSWAVLHCSLLGLRLGQKTCVPRRVTQTLAQDHYH